MKQHFPQRWSFVFTPPMGGIREVGSAQLLLNMVDGEMVPFTILDYEVDEDFIIYRLIPDEDYRDDPRLETELMPEIINGSVQFIAIIAEEVNSMFGGSTIVRK